MPVTMPLDVSGLFKSTRENGYLFYYESTCHTKTVDGINFIIRHCPALLKKGQETGINSVQYKSGINPFLPPDPNLIITDLGTHKLVFNKYCVVPNHLLLLTSEFILQEAPLEKGDFEAMDRVMGMIPGEWMAFYNSGPETGASQPHRHLQLIPNDSPPVVSGFKDGQDTIPILTGRLHKLKRFQQDYSLGDLWYEEYMKLRDDILPTENASYSLLFTKKWMLMVPRMKERYGRISFNTLAFAGYLLTSREEDQQILLRTDLKQVLQTLTFPNNIK